MKRLTIASDLFLILQMLNKSHLKYDIGFKVQLIEKLKELSLFFRCQKVLIVKIMQNKKKPKF
jgi:hypothetical protein